MDSFLIFLGVSIFIGTFGGFWIGEQNFNQKKSTCWTYDHETKGFGFLFFLVFGIVTATIWFIGFGQTEVPNNYNEFAQYEEKGNCTVNVSSQRIYSLDDDMKVYGRLRHGYGTIEGKQIFTYVIKDGEGFFQLRDMYANGVKIEESDGTPRIDRHYYTCSKTWFLLTSESTFTQVYIIIPEGSIEQDGYSPN